MTDSGAVGFIIDFGFCVLAFDAAASMCIFNAADEDIVIEVIVSEFDGMLVFEFIVLIGDETISSFNGGTISIEVPYELDDIDITNAIVVYYRETSDDELIVIRGHYDIEKEAVVFTTNHFSQYLIGYNPVQYTDVTSGWYKDAIDYIAARGYPVCVLGDMFEPERVLTRGEFTATLLRAYNITLDLSARDNFDDVDSDAVYAPYLATAKRLGIAKGIGDNLFAPELEITREEMLALLYRTLVNIGELPDSIDNGRTLSDFVDADMVATWFVDELDALIQAGMVDGMGDNMLELKSLSTRATMAQMIYNLHTR